MTLCQSSCRLDIGHGTLNSVIIMKHCADVQSHHSYQKRTRRCLYSSVGIVPRVHLQSLVDTHQINPQHKQLFPDGNSGVTSVNYPSLFFSTWQSDTSHVRPRHGTLAQTLLHTFQLSKLFTQNKPHGGVICSGESR